MGLERARDVALCGAGVAILFAHLTYIKRSLTLLPELGRSIKRHPNQVGVRFRKVRAKNGKRLGYIPGMHRYSASCSHTHDAKGNDGYDMGETPYETHLPGQARTPGSSPPRRNQR